MPLGALARASSWEHGRYEGPYLRDLLMDEGVMVETLETSHTYTRIGELYEAVRAALRGAMAGRGHPGIVMCHVSHVYRDGASLYFTFLCGRDGGDRDRAVARGQDAPPARRSSPPAARSPTTTRSARDHAPYMEAEVGALGLEALRAVKERLDPAGIMNPGKLLAS